MNPFNKLATIGRLNRRWIAISLTAIVAGLLTLWGIYGIGQYGVALFVLTPIFIGFGSTVLYGYRVSITSRESMEVGFLTLSVFAAGLILFAIEGIICIVMAAPIGLLLTAVGSRIGYVVLDSVPGHAAKILLLLIALIPATAFTEKTGEPMLVAVTTSVEIDATAQQVWQNVITFPQLAEPEELIFRAGIAYPIRATISGTGVGAVRHCDFTTGSFVEPITVWKPPYLLGFSVVEQPASMKELSFWDVDAPHLHDYFVSKRGQFKLTALPGGKTKLEGTTWYYHNIKPAFYWHLWSNYILHQIHRRVLNHIKQTTEAGLQTPTP
jgi:hypothetical protein